MEFVIIGKDQRFVSVCLWLYRQTIHILCFMANTDKASTRAALARLTIASDKKMSQNVLDDTNS